MLCCDVEEGPFCRVLAIVKMSEAVPLFMVRQDGKNGTLLFCESVFRTLTT